MRLDPDERVVEEAMKQRGVSAPPSTKQDSDEKAGTNAQLAQKADK